MNQTHLFLVTRKFTGGTLKGMSHTTVSPVGVSVGFKCDRPVGGSPYIVTRCIVVDSETTDTQVV